MHEITDMDLLRLLAVMVFLLVAMVIGISNDIERNDHEHDEEIKKWLNEGRG